jgi:small redox-active disulfide protein 2
MAKSATWLRGRYFQELNKETWRNGMTKHDVTQIKIGKHKVGLMGLKSAMEEMAINYSQESDEEISTALLNRLSKNNYIPNHVRESYGRAMVREFKKFLGQPVIEEKSEVLEIRVLGPGCAQCDQLEQEVIAVLTEMKLAADMEHVREIKEIGKYGVMGMPALIINGKAVCAGKVPPKYKIQKWLENARKDNL